MNNVLISISIVLVTVIIYLFSRWLYKRVYTPLLLPVAVSTFIIVIILIMTNISYDTYMLGGEWINKFLGPAVVALAYPLYQNREVFKRLALPMFVGTFVGAFVGVVSGVLLSRWAGFQDVYIYSITPKSVTTPVAMDISHSLGGIDTLAAVFVMVAGIAGAMFGTYVFKWFHLKTEIGRGIGYGSASHAIGTSKALEHSPLEGSVSTIAMILSAVFVSIITPYMMLFLM